MKQLGKTKLMVHEVGLGGIPIQRINAGQVSDIIDAMILQKMNFIDTARAYSNSEALIGEAIKGRREHFVLASKSMAKTYEAMKRDVDISLANLQTDVIDLYQLHNPKATDDISGPYHALEEAKAMGKIRHIGITNHSAPFLLQVMKQYQFDTIQFPYNFLEAQGEEVFRVAHEAGLGTIAMKPLAGGVIQRGYLAIKFIQNNPNITLAIPGMASVEEVLENSHIKEPTYSSEELAYMQELRATTDKAFCHRCGYCLPCTKGIEIPVMFTFEGYFNRYDLKNWARDRYQSMAVKADACIACGVCETRCPYHLHIIEKMKQVANIFQEGERQS